MRIAVTGANGFIGQAVVQALINAGHEIDALVRTHFPQQWQAEPKVYVTHCDLLQPDSLSDALAKCDVVIHLAAVMQGGNQYHDTLAATRNLLAAMDAANIHRLIALSSIAVLDYVQAPAMSDINENTPLNNRDKELGNYARMKRDQEHLLTQWYKDGKQLLLMRPGLVYSDDQLATAHAGFKVLLAKHEGEVPVVHVNDVAAACAQAVEHTTMSHEVIHLLDAQLPSQHTYINALKQRGVLSGGISLPWCAFAGCMSLLRIPLALINKIPDGIRRNSVCARQKPFRFSHAKAQRLLNWQSVHSLND